MPAPATVTGDRCGEVDGDAALLLLCLGEGAAQNLSVAGEAVSAIDPATETVTAAAEGTRAHETAAQAAQCDPRPAHDLVSDTPHTMILASQQRTGDFPAVIAGSSSISTPIKRKRSDSSVAAGNGMAPNPVTAHHHGSEQGRQSDAGTSEAGTHANPSLGHFMGFSNEYYRCICGTTVEPEEGTSIQCESCLAWQHAGCFGLSAGELDGTAYFCQLCDLQKHYSPNVDYIGYVQQLHGVTMGTAQGMPVSHAGREGKKSRHSINMRGKGKAKPILRFDSGSAVLAEREQAATHSSDPSGPAPPTKSHRKRATVPLRPSKAKSLAADEEPRAEMEAGDNRGTRPTASLPLDTMAECRPFTLEYIPIDANIMRDARLHELMQAGGQYYEGPSFPSPGLEGDNSRLEHSMANNIAQLVAELSAYDVATRPCSPPLQISQSQRSAGSALVACVSDNARDAAKTHVEGLAANDGGLLHKPSGINTPKVYAIQAIAAGTYIGEVCGEVYSSISYEEDPLNRYMDSGLPQPFVNRIGYPFNLVIDSRCYASELRHIRSSCDPNTILYPTVSTGRDDVEEETSTIFWGLYTTTAVDKGAEITLGWQWDESHIVRLLPETELCPTRLHPALSQRYKAVCRDLASNYPLCACHDMSRCLRERLVKVAGRLGENTSEAAMEKAVNSQEEIVAPQSIAQRGVRRGTTETLGPVSVTGPVMHSAMRGWTPPSSPSIPPSHRVNNEITTTYPPPYDPGMFNTLFLHDDTGSTLGQGPATLARRGQGLRPSVQSPTLSSSGRDAISSCQDALDPPSTLEDADDVSIASTLTQPLSSSPRSSQQPYGVSFPQLDGPSSRRLTADGLAGTSSPDAASHVRSLDSYGAYVRANITVPPSCEDHDAASSGERHSSPSGHHHLLGQLQQSGAEEEPTNLSKKRRIDLKSLLAVNDKKPDGHDSAGSGVLEVAPTRVGNIFDTPEQPTATSAESGSEVADPLWWLPAGYTQSSALHNIAASIVIPKADFVRRSVIKTVTDGLLDCDSRPVTV